MLKSWREVARPHQDVIKGTFQQSDFAADISQVVNGTAPEEYQDPVKFYARTYVTEGLKQLLLSVVGRLNGASGDKVIELQTNFGGGKTHTLLAVYHLATRDGAVETLPGVGPILAEAGVAEVPQAKVAVIDGNLLAPNQPVLKGGLEINTLWGNLAYQLLGAAGYEKVRASDEAGTSPGKALMEEILKEAGPCVILMDELVAYYRQFNNHGALKGGTYESNISFVQALTEAVKGANTAVLLASLPESDAESAGSFGKKVRKELEKVFGRLNSVWRPVSAEEGFEVVKRRLFEDITETADVEATCSAFDGYYHQHKEELPAKLQEAAWHDLIRKCYPIHPEIFTRLYEDWSTLEKFQKTRGVLQLMALVINRLWARGDEAPMILPGSLPLDDQAVVNRCAQYLPNNWATVIDAEIDGAHASAKAVDACDPRFGAIEAARRVARTIFLGSASGNAAQAVRGIEYKDVLLGCALPGHELAFYDDAIRKLREKQHYLFNANDNYWYDTKPGLKRTMETYKERITGAQISDYLATTLKQKWGSPSGIASVHVFAEHKDVPDDITSGLRAVVLPLDCAYTPAGAERTFDAAKVFLERHGTNPRMRKNRLVFLAADLNVMSTLTDLTATVLAWREVRDAIRNQAINATMQDAQQVDAQQSQTQHLLEGTVVNGFRYLLVPVPVGASDVGFEVLALSNSSTSSRLGETVLQALYAQDMLIRNWAPMFLKQMLDNAYFKNGTVEVSTRKVWTDMASFYALPRLINAEAFLAVIQQGAANGMLGYAEGKEGVDYLGLKIEENIGMAQISDVQLLIAADTAKAYKQAHTAPVQPQPATPETPTAPQPSASGSGSAKVSGPTPVPGATAKHQFSGMIALNLKGSTQSLQQVLDEVLAHLSASGANVHVQLDIQAKNPNPFLPTTIRTVSENAAALNFQLAQFN